MMDRTHLFKPGAMDCVDLRSDTVTRPTSEMLEAMMAAPVGDDVLGDDPTVGELERLAAAKVGMEAALLVPSGTMGNQVALACHAERGDAILAEQDAHLLYYEVGAPAILAGVVVWTLASDHGAMDPDVIRRRAVKRTLHTPGTTLLCLENTHNRAGGTVLSPSQMASYKAVADETGMKIHLDGARVFNASVALGVDVKEITKHVDSVSVCLSKGLGSPIGTVLCGGEAFIQRARVWRKRLGGGMRQAGFLAACGIVSLTAMVDRLSEDHARARRLAEALNALGSLSVDLDHIQTNIVLAETKLPASDWCSALGAHGVLALPADAHRVRFVLHYDVDDAKLDRAIAAVGAVATSLA